MARYRSPGGEASTQLQAALARNGTKSHRARRRRTKSLASHGRVVLAAVTVGACLTATGSQALQSAAFGDFAGIHNGIGGEEPVTAPAIVTAQTDHDAQDEVRNLARTAKLAKSKDFTAPAEGRFTSGYGMRWGMSHKGIDIANKIGTPIRSVAAGKVIESGAASGFGLWVRVRHADGAVTVYGHVDSTDVKKGDKVDAGDKIAEMGNRGNSTGPHLHFEVWKRDKGKKLDPRDWLAERGVDL